MLSPYGSFFTKLCSRSLADPKHLLERQLSTLDLQTSAVLASRELLRALAKEGKRSWDWGGHQGDGACRDCSWEVECGTILLSSSLSLQEKRCTSPESGKALENIYFGRRLS